MTRREAREVVLQLLFESEFRSDESADLVLTKALEIREITINDYVRNVYLGVFKNIEFIDSQIELYSHGWKKNRISPVARAALRLAIFEMHFCDDIPDTASINEAIELIKKFDDEEKVKPFVNGVLNSVYRAKAEKGDC